jgi:hypothetical protein
MRAAVVSVGGRNESLGAFKIAAWLRRKGWEVEMLSRVNPMFDRFALYAFSCVFSWDLPALAEQATIAKGHGEVWIGGPAVTFHNDNWRWVKERTGIEPTRGIDERFEEEPVDCPMVYFSRGCPAYTSACGFCPVPKLEGTKFRFYPNAKPARLLLDNNLSALPVDYQEYIIRRYRDEWRGGKVDCNSGFEPHTFTEETLKRWEAFPLQCWRFGYDDLSEREQSLEMMRLLGSHGYRGKRVRVYTLIGNEPKEACRQRILEVIDHGFEPCPQRLRPLNWRGGPLPTLHDWTEPDLIAWQRFYTCPQLWKTMRPEEFRYQGRFPLRCLTPSQPGA